MTAHERHRYQTMLDALPSIADHDKEFEGLEDWQTMVFRMSQKAKVALAAVEKGV